MKDDFKVKPLWFDTEALVLIVLGVLLVVGTVVVLVFLPDALWDRLVERSKIMYAGLVGVVGILYATGRRVSLRREAIKGYASSVANPLDDSLKGGEG